MIFSKRSIRINAQVYHQSRLRVLMNAERETFRIYVEWIEMFFIANSIVKQPGERYKDINRLVRQRKCAISVTEIGPQSYSTRSKPTMITMQKRDILFVDIAEALEVNDPAPVDIADTGNFHFRKRTKMFQILRQFAVK